MAILRLLIRGSLVRAAWNGLQFYYLYEVNSSSMFEVSMERHSSRWFGKFRTRVWNRV
jgi:hypothetical protein